KHKRKNTAYYWLMKVSLFSVHKNNKNKAKRKPAERSNLLLTFLSRFFCPGEAFVRSLFRPRVALFDACMSLFYYPEGTKSISFFLLFNIMLQFIAS
ncbi:MAG: hypothetical protein K6F35_07310, partial [Lachnospiraceae bacterium]|nr:hypothetical protein [Lachnospiraceae bacterium]